MIWPFSKLSSLGLICAQSHIVRVRSQDLSDDGRFDLAYSKAHAFAIAALRRKGYRSDDRYIVFQALPHTLGADAAITRTLAKAHNERNLMEYQRRMESIKRSSLTF